MEPVQELSSSVRSRAALLQSPGDPFLLTFWFSLAHTRWLDEVDHLYVLVNSDAEKAVLDYISQIMSVLPKTTLILKNHRMEHGHAIAEMLDLCDEELVMLIEDDAFIFKSGLVDACFSQIEEGECDLVGSKRGSASNWIINQANQKWQVIDTGMGDQGPHFWPNFLFARRKDLQKTDRNFASKTWQPGEYIGMFNASTPSLCVGDTFVWASLQLREMGLRIQYVDQYHAAPEDIDHALDGKFLFDGKCGWLHAGSLSSGFGGFLSDKALPDIVHTDEERSEIERRVAFWQWFVEYYLAQSFDHPPISKLAVEYMGWINRMIQHYKLRPKQITRRQTLYKELMNWT